VIRLWEPRLSDAAVHYLWKQIEFYSTRIVYEFLEQIENPAPAQELNTNLHQLLFASVAQSRDILKLRRTTNSSFIRLVEQYAKSLLQISTHQRGTTDIWLPTEDFTLAIFIGERFFDDIWLENLLEQKFFPHWTQSLERWCKSAERSRNYSQDCAFLMNWYMSWKDVIPASLITHDSVRNKIHSVLLLMSAFCYKPV